jgi:hypothetical protein
MSTDQLDEDTMTALHALLSRGEPAAGPSPHALRRLAAGDLPDPDAAALRSVLRQDPDAAARLAVEEEADRAFLAAHPFDEVAPELFRRAAALAPPAPSRGLFALVLRPRSLGWAIATVVTALLVATFTPVEPDRGPDPIPSRTGNRLKGATLEAFQEVDGAPVRLGPEARLAAGAVVQFRVSSSRGFVALLGVDGTGTVSRYLPVGGEVSDPFTPGAGRALPDALVLDDAPGPEVFLVFLSDEPLLVEDLEQAVHDVLDRGGDPARATFDVPADVAAFAIAKEGGAHP